MSSLAGRLHKCPMALFLFLIGITGNAAITCIRVLSQKNAPKLHLRCIIITD